MAIARIRTGSVDASAHDKIVGRLVDWAEHSKRTTHGTRKT